VKLVDPDGREDFDDIQNLFDSSFSLIGSTLNLNENNFINSDTGLLNISKNDITNSQKDLANMGEAIKNAPVTSTALLATIMTLGAIYLSNKDAIEDGIDTLNSQHGIDLKTQTITFENAQFNAKLKVGEVSSLETNIRFDSKNSLQIGLEIKFEISGKNFRVNNSMDVVFTKKIGK